MAANSDLFKPDVLWAQTRDMIMLRVQVQPAEKPDFNIHDTHMDFKVYGTGGSSVKKHYGFELVFHEAINTEKCRFKMSDKEVEFRLLKKNPGEWSKLQSTHTKPHWIKVDFDHFNVSDDEKEDDEKLEELQQFQELRRKEVEMKKQLEFHNKMTDISDKLKALYLVLYNAGQWLGFLLISTRLIFLLTVYGQEGMARAYSDTVNILMVCQSLSVLEIAHNVIGIVKGSAMSSFLQIFGRNFILFLVIPFAVSIHTNPIVFFLFLFWSLIELVRYPYYALSVVKMELGWITWLRYTIWIPLYPLGFTCEYIIYIMSIFYGPQGGGWGYELPNSLNVSVNATFIKIVLLIIGPFLFYQMYAHMASQRRKKLNTKKKD